MHSTAPTGAAGGSSPTPLLRGTFGALLVNTLVSGATTMFVWFAITFWVFLETRSVVATSVIGGSFALASAVLGVGFGTFVDRHRRKVSMLVSSIGATVCFVVASAIYLAVDTDNLLRLANPWFWALILVTLTGSVFGNLRGIALSTCVSLLVPESERDRANGLVGMVTGIGFTLTSVFSGLAVGQLGMGWVYAVAVGLMVLTSVHLGSIRLDEPRPERSADGPQHFDLRGAVTAVRAVPGLAMLIGFAACNNLLGGVFMSLMDAYGLSLVSVEAWGILFEVLSLGFILGGLGVARFGLGPDPLRLIVAGNLLNWAICSVFTLRSSIVMLAVGMFVWLVSVPVVEAAEQTVLQRAVPFEVQGRVFGFAQLVENAASPVTSLAMGPLAETVFIPTMTDGRGAEWIGGWYGSGYERGLAVMFSLAGLVGLVVTLGMRWSRSYRLLGAASRTAATETP